MKRLQDRIAVITGGSGGIGRATAVRFLEAGASVVLVDIDQAGLDKAARELDEDDRLLLQTADVTREEDVQRSVEAAIARSGRIDVFFNNAGIKGKVARGIGAL